jgi:hypothetical protein
MAALTGRHFSFQNRTRSAGRAGLRTLRQQRTTKAQLRLPIVNMRQPSKPDTAIRHLQAQWIQFRIALVPET